MISTLRIVLSSNRQALRGSPAPIEKASPYELDRQYVHLLALAFCEGLPKDFTFAGSITDSIKSFVSAVRGELKGVKSPGADDPDRSSKLRSIGGMKDAVDESWNELRKLRVLFGKPNNESKVPMVKPSKLYKNEIEYRAFLLVKAFVAGFKVVRNKIGADIPALDLWRVMDSEKIDDAKIMAIYTKVYDKFRLILESDNKSKTAPSKEPGEGKSDAVPSKSEKVVPKEKGKSGPIQKDVKNTIKELGKNIDWFESQIKVMPMEKQRQLKSLMDEVLDIMTAPAVKTAGLEDALSRLVKFIRPMLGEFLKRVREEKVDVPVQELIWRDPDRLRAVLEDMEPEHLRRVMEQTEKILGMLAYS